MVTRALALLVLAGVSQGALAAEIPGRAVVERVCANCHGMNGLAVQGGNSAISPIITAQKKDYLVTRLMDYRSGKIQHPQMSLIANMISEQDIVDVSDWYSRIGVSSPMFGKPLAEIEAMGGQLSPRAKLGMVKADQVCASCHGLDGRAVASSDSLVIPNLAPQDKAVLEFRLKDYQAGRKQHALMTPIAKSLDTEDIRNLSEWYSSVDVRLQEPE